MMHVGMVWYGFGGRCYLRNYHVLRIGIESEERKVGN